MDPITLLVICSVVVIAAACGKAERNRAKRNQERSLSYLDEAINKRFPDRWTKL